MLNLARENIVWAWTCPHTGIVFDETWAPTEAYATARAKKHLGKRRFEIGAVVPIRLTLEVLGPEQAQELRQQYAKFVEEVESSRQQRRKVDPPPGAPD